VEKLLASTACQSSSGPYAGPTSEPFVPTSRNYGSYIYPSTLDFERGERNKTRPYHHHRHSTSFPPQTITSHQPPSSSPRLLEFTSDDQVVSQINSKPSTRCSCQSHFPSGVHSLQLPRNKTPRPPDDNPDDNPDDTLTIP
jgi:hypothetical protein